MSLSKQSTYSQPRRRLLCLEQLENRVLLTAMAHPGPASVSSANHDSWARQELPSVLLRMPDVSSRSGRSSLHDDSHRQMDGVQRDQHSQSHLGTSLRANSKHVEPHSAHVSMLPPRTIQQSFPQAPTPAIVRSDVPSSRLDRAESLPPPATISGAVQSLGVDPPGGPGTPISHHVTGSESLDVKVAGTGVIGDATIGHGSSLPTAPLRAGASTLQEKISIPTPAHSVIPITPLASWSAEQANVERTESETEEPIQSETNRYGGMINLEQMPLLRDTFPLIRIESRAKVQDMNADDPDEKNGDLMPLLREVPGSSDENESLSDPRPHKDVEANEPTSDRSSTCETDTADLAFADSDMVEQFGGLIDIPQEITSGRSLVEGLDSYEAVIPLNALQVDVIIGQAPLMELDDGLTEAEETTSAPVSRDVRPTVTTSAAMVLIPVFVHTRRKVARGKPERED